MYSENYNKDTDQEAVALIGFRLDPQNESPDLYTLLIYGGEHDFPFVVNEQIIFFRNPQLSVKVASLLPSNMPSELRDKGITPTVPELICDIAKSLHIIESENKDDSSIILNCINIFTDLVPATGISMPAMYKDILNRFAGHLTFNREFGDFLRQENISRNEIIDAILWCIGAITVKVKLCQAEEG